MTEPKSRSERPRRGFFAWVGCLFRLIQFLVRAIIALVGGWIAYSRLFVPHRLTLSHALGGERRTFSANGIELSYYVSGTGKPLVLLHSINAAASAYEMKPIYDHFAAMRRVYALDLPGFGFSARHDLVYSPQLYTDAILSFIRSQVADSGGPADVVALSLSSEFAARAADAAPEFFSSLTLISPTGFGRTGGVVVRSEREEERSTRFLNSLHSPLWSQPLYDLLTSRPSLRFFLGMSFAGPVDEKLLAYAYLTSHQPGAYYAPFYFISGKLFSPDIRLVYGRLKLPVMVLYNKDAFTSFELLDEFRDRPNWRLVRIRGTRGLPHFEKSEQTNKVLAAFLADYSLPMQVDIEQ